tara:strand:- start:1147 stop:1341 length:195 start_codon:yes stop_codon:yes gene_type:complete
MKLIVLDFEKDITYVYTITEHDINAIDMVDPQSEDWLSYFSGIENKHREVNCQWMLSKNDIIIK